jgi:LPS-assembly lipoprotein
MSGITKKSSRALVYMTIVLMLYACGFQLRGSIDLSEDIAPVYIEQRTLFELGREIKSLLATNKIEVVAKESQSKSTLVLAREGRERRVLSVDGSGRAREYLLTYTVDFIIKIKQSGDTSDSLSISRSLLFDPDAVLAVTNESEILYRDMQRDIARLILLKLQASSLRNAAQNAGPVQEDTKITE